jgi:hypothetical protein
MRCVHAWPWVEESEGEKRVRHRDRLILKRRRRGRGEVGVPGAVPHGGANRAERGMAGVPIGEEQRGRRGTGLAAERAGGVAWPCHVTGQTGEGKRG